MEEIARGVQAPTKAKALVATLIPYELAGFETYETPKRGTVEAARIPMLAGADTPVGIGGTAVITA